MLYFMKHKHNDNEHNLDSEEERFVDDKIEEEMQNTLPKAPEDKWKKKICIVTKLLSLSKEKRQTHELLVSNSQLSQDNGIPDLNEQSEELFEKLKGEDKDEYLRPGCIGEELAENDNEEDEEEEDEDKKDFIFENQPVDAKNFDLLCQEKVINIQSAFDLKTEENELQYLPENHSQQCQNAEFQMKKIKLENGQSKEIEIENLEEQEKLGQNMQEDEVNKDIVE
eukprot:TRINITY_DN13230_c0_g2_i1.p1 TRINITY_DN13230_c0_g2~~TRINITY_DN13230_c0_g2_i1.p1  ORF type:complete len:225 (-),score=78.10 TRINITY_DN13230_c0_g2_i1:87-761(-)